MHIFANNKVPEQYEQLLQDMYALSAEKFALTNQQVPIEKGKI